MQEEQEEVNQDPPISSASKRRSLITPWRFVLVLAFVSFGIALSVIWIRFGSVYFERSAPEISIVDMPRGVGIAPVTLSAKINDFGAGLDEVVIRLQQRGRGKELLKQRFKSQEEAQVTVNFGGEDGSLIEDNAQLEIRAFDKSYWSNTSAKTIILGVDFHRPTVEVISTQHNGRRGGAQLVFYRAEDRNIANSGVRVDGLTFQGFPARAFDRELKDPTLFAVIYALDMRRRGQSITPRAFAEDRVGNATTVGFASREQDRKPRQLRINLDKNFLDSTVANLVDKNADELRNWEQRTQQSIIQESFSADNFGSQGARFSVINGTLRTVNDQQLQDILSVSRPESYFEDAFLLPRGSPSIAFADEVSYFFEDQVLDKSLSTAHVFKRGIDSPDVVAANHGVVVHAGELGVYGKLVVIDHGVGLASLYGNLSEIATKKGARVSRGQRIGTVGSTGLARESQLTFEIRNQGVPIDPIAWWDSGWVQAHIKDKIEDVRRTYGIGVKIGF